MRPHHSSTRGRREAAQAPNDPAAITRQVFAEAKPFDTYPSYAAPLSFESLPLPGQAFTGCVGSIAPIQHVPYAIDALRHPVPLTNPCTSFSSPNHCFVHSVRHETAYPHQPRLVNSNSAVQLQTRRLLQNVPIREKSQQQAAPKNETRGTRHSERTTLQSNEARSHGDRLKAGNPQPPGSLGSPCSFGPPTRSLKSQAHIHLTTNPAPTPRAQATQSDSASTNDRGYVWLEHGQKDPSVRSLQARSPEDNDRRDALRQKGGSCAPCRRSKKQCDDHDPCQSCIHRKIPSEAGILASIQSLTYIPGLEDISLRDLDPSTLPNNRSSAEVCSETMIGAQGQTIGHVNDWFEMVSGNIDRGPFSNDIHQREVFLGITSASNGKTETSFNLEFVHISKYLEATPYPLDDEILEAAFIQHASAQLPGTPGHDALRSQCASRLGSAVSQIFAFLKCFADAKLYAHMNNIPAARATIAIVYANLYHMLLSKCDDFCSFTLQTFRHDFQYCTRTSRKILLEDALRGLAQYYSVLTGLANSELQSSPEVAALFVKLEQRAKGLLRLGGIPRLFLRIHKSLRSLDAGVARGRIPQPQFEELLHDYLSDLPPIKSLSITLRVNSSQGDIAPLPTEAFRDTDPYNHGNHFKVRDVLKRSQDSVLDPTQMYINGIVDNFDFLGQTQPDEPDFLATYSGDLQGLFFDRNSVAADTPSESLDPEHGSLRPSQQDTDTQSLKSESTMQDQILFEHNHLMDAFLGVEQEDNDWQQVPSRKRRQRSDDSQNSSQLLFGGGNHKHIKLKVGRESPPPYQHNYFDVLTGEPTTLG